MKQIFLIIAFVAVAQYTNAQVTGCTDPLAKNYNSLATVNDGSCTYNSLSVSPIQDWTLSDTLSETSGLILWNGKVWSHNDDTDINIYALDTANAQIKEFYPLIGTKNNDWEDISHDENYVYVGDFGNNVDGNRTDLKILRIDKSSITTAIPIIDTIAFTYSAQTDFAPAGSNNTNFDCEGFIVANDSIYIFTKEWISKKTSLYSLSKEPGIHVANYKATHDVQGLITGATYLESEKIIALCGYELTTVTLNPFLYLLYDFQNHDFFTGNKRKVSLNLPYHQVEGIATEDGQTYYISNEKFQKSILNIAQKLHKIDLTTYLCGYLGNKPETPMVFFEGNVLSSTAPSGNQWYNQKGIINGATQQEYTAKEKGEYYVVVTLAGCSSEKSNVINSIGIKDVDKQADVKVYPNPISNELIIERKGDRRKLYFEIVNAAGQVVYKDTIVDKKVIETTHLPSGIYIVKLGDGNNFEFRKVIKE